MAAGSNGFRRLAFQHDFLITEAWVKIPWEEQDGLPPEKDDLNRRNGSPTIYNDSNIPSNHIKSTTVLSETAEL